jgi:endoglucanase
MQSAAFMTAVLALASSAAIACAQGAGYWHTSGSQILDSHGNAVRIAGISWSGFESRDQVAHGLGDQDYRQILYTIKATGFNTIRLPFSNQMVENPIVPPFDKTPGAINSELSGLNSLEIMDKIIAAAGDQGLKVILDDHRSEAGDSNESNGLWYTRAYPDNSWIADWEMLVRRYKDFTDAHGNPIVIGVDLRNEPYTMVNGEPIGSCWTGDTTTGGCPVTDTEHNWPQAAGRAAQTVLSINPNLLIFVEGLDCYSGSCNWQGGNLEGAGLYPVELPFSGHLVYSAHDYGPDVSTQPWFRNDTTTALLEQGWMKHWAYLSAGNIAPVWLGEFGTGNNETDIQNNEPGSQGQWFSALVNFLRSQPRISWAYWAVNGEDRSGLLTGTYSAPPPHSLKMEQLASIQLAQNTLAGNPLQSAGLDLQEAILRVMKPQSVSGICAAAALSLVFFALVLAQRRRPRRKQPLGGKSSLPATESNPPTLPSLPS